MLDFTELRSCVVLNGHSSAYSQQHVMLYKTVKVHQPIINLIAFTIKHRYDWLYLTVGTNLSCCFYKIAHWLWLLNTDICQSSMQDHLHAIRLAALLIAPAQIASYKLYESSVSFAPEFSHKIFYVYIIIKKIFINTPHTATPAS
jgi:hypothetical protein